MELFSYFAFGNRDGAPDGLLGRGHLYADSEAKAATRVREEHGVQSVVWVRQRTQNDAGAPRRSAGVAPQKPPARVSLRPMRGTRATCHPTREHAAHGLCQHCYYVARRDARLAQPARPAT